MHKKTSIMRMDNCYYQYSLFAYYIMSYNRYKLEDCYLCLIPVPFIPVPLSQFCEVKTRSARKENVLSLLFFDLL